MDLLANLLMTWIGIDPVKRTLGGWGYKSVAEFFIQHTSLTKKETSKFSMNVKYQFEGMFGLLSPHEKAHLIEVIIRTYPLMPECPHRTQQLLDQIYYIYLDLKNLLKTKSKKNI